jgi:predicted nucleic acid-binding Zn ribbon protein
MTLVDTLKQVFTANERVVYRCDACGETFDVDTGVDDPSCTACESTEVRQINRV